MKGAQPAHSLPKVKWQGRPNLNEEPSSWFALRKPFHKTRNTQCPWDQYTPCHHQEVVSGEVRSSPSFRDGRRDRLRHHPCDVRLRGLEGTTEALSSPSTAHLRSRDSDPHSADENTAARSFVPSYKRSTHSSQTSLRVHGTQWWHSAGGHRSGSAVRQIQVQTLFLTLHDTVTVTCRVLTSSPMKRGRIKIPTSQGYWQIRDNACKQRNTWPRAATTVLPALSAVSMRSKNIEWKIPEMNNS